MSDRMRARGRRSALRPLGGWLLLLVAALSFVTWRQARAVEMERALREVEAERSIAEGERVALTRRLEQLRSRTRIVQVARDRLGMHLPEDREIVFLTVPLP